MPPLQSTADFCPVVDTGRVSFPSKSSNDAQSVSFRKHARRQRRTVTFDPCVRGQLALHINNFSSEEKLACWYTPRESHAMKADTVRAVQELCQSSQKEDTDEFCRRGLVKHLPLVAQERYEMKQNARDVVLNEQDLQIEEGSSDPDFIAMIYADASEYAQQMACVQADRDEWDAWMN